MKKTLITPLLMLGLVAAPAFAGDVSVAEPYARAVPPGQPNSAVFMQLTNASQADRALVSAASPAAETVELHTHRLEDGMMKMRRIAQIDLPAGETVSLQPGGLHVMLIGLRQPLQPGDAVEVTLQLDDGSDLSLRAPVRKIMPMGHMHADPH
ncbi:copper chaperone PCu(A)C [Thiohalocapsa marina]|uniref:Copper chaperone PCu(A)C n=2 Tax=Thiohalocapsa marina TaxID=424902 RepID=A0A5M8FDG4_9GAMM|nr:copper chaperone PCu(A)C [Thiohalocapsa marina]KAA6182699.1 copper chaperone PCu(A)C [Thiohalocapsa marina]